jgi:hypothetical protein
LPRSPSTYSLPPGTTPQQPNTVISSSMFNAFADDVAQTFNTVQPIAYGGTGSSDLKLNDTDFGIKDNSDPTKIGQFNASNLPTATTRTYDLPYYSGTLGLVSDIIGYIRGLALTNDAGDAANDIGIATGSAVDSTGAVSILLSSALIKRVDATWVAGTNQGGRFYTTLANGTIYVYIIRNPTTYVVDIGFSDNASNPTGGASYPSGFTQYARIGYFGRVSSVNGTPRLYIGQPQPGDVVNTWRSNYTTYTSTTLVIPFDDTIPQITEGLNILTRSITLSKSTNRVRVRTSTVVAGDGVIGVAGAIFEAGAANAKGAAACLVAGTGYSTALIVEAEWAPGTTNLTVNFNVGPGGGTAYINGNNVTRLFGGAEAATMVIEEIEV